MKYVFFLMFLSLPSSTLFGDEIYPFTPLDDRYALVIGISSYQDNNLNLKYARKDAEAFYKVLIRYGRFKEENVILLVDKSASREGIRKNIEGWLKNNTQKSDLVIIFFSGHGTQLPDSDGDEPDGLDECLVPYDFDTKDFSTAIIDDLFAYWIRNLRSNKILIIFDNCFSGGAAKQKGFLMPGMKGGKVEDDFTPDISREVPRKGTSLIAASKPDQISFESDSLCNGLFTYFLINSIDSKSDNDFNNVVDAQELFYSTRKKTLKFSIKEFKRKQEPIFINQIEERLDLFYLPIKKPKELDNKRMEELFYKVKQCYDPKKRIEILEEAYGLDPTNLIVNWFLASDYEYIKEFEKALYHYDYIYSVTKSKGYYPPITANIGALHKKRGDLDKALFWYLKAVEGNDNNPRLYNSIAKIYLQKHDTLSAIENFNLSIRVQSLQKDSYLKLFYIYLFQNNLSMAYRFIQDCYRINPTDFETIYWIGMFEKYYKINDVIGDSLLTYFELNSKIEIVENTLKKESRIDWGTINDKKLKGEELEKHLFDSAISQFPYYADFYKRAILASLKNKLMNKLDYSNKYLKYSRVHPDTSFISKYISN